MSFLAQLTGSFGDTLFTVAAFLVVLYIIVFVHEFGHFWVARRCGVTVKAFSIGFGKEIIGFTDRHGTRWMLARWPLGGYVRFMDDENAASVPAKGVQENLTEAERAGLFHSKPLAHRAAVVAAGPIANFILALLIFTASYWLIGTPTTAPVIDEVGAGTPAERAGLKAGDIVKEIDGKQIAYFSDLQKIIGAKPGQSVRFVVERGGERIVTSVVPEARQITDPLGNKVEMGVIGVRRSTGAAKIENVKLSLPGAAARAVEDTASLSWQIISSLPRIPAAIGRVFSGQKQSELGGPIAIAEMSAQAAKSGPAAMLWLIAVISIMLGIMNLLPIPLLDGGHLLFYGIEALRGRPLDEAKQELSYKIGFAIVGTLMLAAILSDVMRKFGLG
jgi:regulator of sigma E protease